MSNIQGKSSLTKIDTGTVEFLEVTFEITEADKGHVAKDPETYVSNFLKAHGQVVNDVILPPDFLEKANDVIKKSVKGSPAYVRYILAHIDRPKEYKSVHVGKKMATKLPPIDPHSPIWKPAPGVKKFASGTIEIFEAITEIVEADKAIAVKEPETFIRKILEGHGQTVNDIVVSKSFAEEAAGLIKVPKQGEAAQMSRRIWCHLDSPWYVWSMWIILKTQPKK